MTGSPYGMTIFCDDIREEVGGKQSLIGCYNNEMNFSVAAPATLPMLCGAVNILIPIGFLFERLDLVINKEDGPETTLLMKVSFESSDMPVPIDVEVGDLKDEPRYIGLSFPWKMQPFHVGGPCLVRVRGYFDSTEVRLGSLKIAFKHDDVAPTASE